MTDPSFFERRRVNNDDARPNDVRRPFQRDRARIIHSAAFRRLQGKTQIMGVGEGDFHRTRLTHSIECAQIGNGLLEIVLAKRDTLSSDFSDWLPSRDLVEAACFAHDLGHPPFGHGGERALHSQMSARGGFEGNGQTLRILTRLEKYGEKGSGLDPTRRLILAVLKYPIPYSEFPANNEHPPKCYLDEESGIVDWACEGFSPNDVRLLSERAPSGKALHRTFDCALMELADDIAYGVHDIEDIVARRLVSREGLLAELKKGFASIVDPTHVGEKPLKPEDLVDRLFAGSRERKQMISMLVNLFVTSVFVERKPSFEHPLLGYRPVLGESVVPLLQALKSCSYELVVRNAKVQQLERRGQRIVSSLFSELLASPCELIPSASWEEGDDADTTERRVCDYVAGMTDSYAEKIYRRLFTPGYGSSGDEL